MKRLKNDIILILIIVVIAFVSAGVYFAMQTEGKSVYVIQNGNIISTYSLKEDITTTITNGDNTNELVIKDKTAYIYQANCPDKICVNHRPISKTGETIVCLPAKLVIEIGE